MVVQNKFKNLMDSNIDLIGQKKLTPTFLIIIFNIHTYRRTEAKSSLILNFYIN